jgi:4-amino-4-deoxy-L-arabinose transferase-like glycosyltransferase
MNQPSRKLPKKRKSQAPKRSRIDEIGWIIWLRKDSRLIFLLLVTIGSLRVVSTYNVFSETSDEGVHLACGMEWLTKGIYSYEPQHPPLGRVAIALGPYAAGVRSYGVPDYFEEGMAILYRDGHHDRNLALARLGILPFFWIACLVVYVWGRWYLGEPGATFAVLLFTFLPPVLAHTGLATTDMPLTAMTGATFLCALNWLRRPNWGNALLFGAVTGLAVLSKFSALAFIPFSLAAALVWYFLSERPRLHEIRITARSLLLPACVAVLTGFLVIWSAYHFSVGSVTFTSLHLPAPELFAGIQEVANHNRLGHSAYLLGEQSQYGWWYFYLVALAVKTPLPFLGLLICGVFLRDRGGGNNLSHGVGLALAFSLGILAFSMFSNINIGVRHILPVYIGFSVVAAAGAVRLLQRWHISQRAGWTLGLLFGWLVLTSGLSHPDYLPYFNALAGREPERVLVDSDLDWGQDMKRLAKRLREVDAKEVALFPFFHVDPVGLGFPAVRAFDPVKPTPGWSALNLTVLKSVRFGLYAERPDIKFWPNQIKPTERIGGGMWLWYFPPDAVPAKP